MRDVTSDSRILDQIQSLVFNASQVVSYKWLSRNFSISSNAAKRTLEEFAKVNEGNKVEVVYAVCGWSKSEPRTYNVQLVPKVKLREVKKGFDEPASQHVYSVQPYLPKTPVQLLSAEYMQAQELFMQSRDVDNCLRDNRGIGESKSVIDRLKAGPGPLACACPPSLKNVTGSITPKADPQPTPPLAEGQKEASVKNKAGGAVVKDENARKNLSIGAVVGKMVPKKVVVGKKKTIVVAGTSSLANIWNKAATKAKAKAATPIAIPILLTGDAMTAIRATEGDGIESITDEEDIDSDQVWRRQANNGNRLKRQVVLGEDISRDEEGMNYHVVVNLVPLEPFERKTRVNTDTENDSRPKIVLPSPAEVELDKESQFVSIPRTHIGVAITEEVSQPVESTIGVKREAESGSETGAGANPPHGPERKKVLKTRINEHGKEITEAACETDGVEENPKGKPVLAPQKSPCAASKNPTDGPIVPAKAPRKSSTTKAPRKVGGRASALKGKGPSQRSLLSFFNKKV